MASKKKIITSDDILGREAVDPEGEILGVVMKLHIEKDMKKIVGLTIDQGFMKPDIFIGINYVKNFGVDAVFLNKVPADKFKGLDVIKSDGKHVGKVVDIASKRHKVSQIIVRKKNSKKRYSIPSAGISQIGESVVLKKNFKAKELE